MKKNQLAMTQLYCYYYYEFDEETPYTHKQTQKLSKKDYRIRNKNQKKKHMRMIRQNKKENKNS